MLVVFANGGGILSSSELRDEATEQAISKGYSVTNNEDVENVITQLQTEQDHGGEFPESSIAQLKADGVDGILVVEVTDYNEEKLSNGETLMGSISLSVRLVDTQTASTQWIKNVNSDDNDLGLIPDLLLLPVALLTPTKDDTTTAQTLVDDALKEFPTASPALAPMNMQ
jgi:hypothetical protein